ncbi:MAG: cupin domain-containing protein [Planctomycetes bacterium]|nr:cupin domain-containing protein [Planctomycetota bacterium]MCB9870105.1 cupin domain-containing protein [Planctomycetota bacterium]
MNKINLRGKFDSFHDTWVPRVVAELNGQAVKVAKFEGPYTWHRHPAEDELFWVVSGRVDIELRDRVVELAAGELFVVPRGVEHRPVAHGIAEVVMFEPLTTRNTGDTRTDRTIEPEDLERL